MYAPQIRLRAAVFRVPLREPWPREREQDQGGCERDKPAPRIMPGRSDPEGAQFASAIRRRTITASSELLPLAWAEVSAALRSVPDLAKPESQSP
jgi:hypothetical protein